jgi:propanol-preferring alcohol dehydrogenase
VKIARRKGTAVLIGLPPASFSCPVVDLVMKGITVRGSIVGTRKDLREALDFAARGLVRCDVEVAPLKFINHIVARLRDGKIQGRVVVQFTEDPEEAAEEVKKEA